SGHEPEDVRLVLENLFQFDSEDQAQLFAGNPIVLGESMDGVTANSFQQAMASAGATTHLEAANDATSDGFQKEQRVAQRRTNSMRRARARPGAILPDRRVGGDRRRKKR
ncbi:MAG: hypothetical protein OEQ74_07555, partial [Gammaproteobacteria bacterium]|nr:hypothetical protein [Gammaproteobacteria bacterium]